MATTHFARDAYKGRSGDGLAAQRVDYITRQGAYSPAEARVRHQGLRQGTEIEREDLVHWEVHNLPSWAKQDEHGATTFFTAAERYTSPHYTAYEEWKFSLPRELDRQQQMEAARTFLHAAFGDTHPYVWAFHCPRAADGGEQPHVHVLWSPRTLDGIERGPEQFFRRYDPKRPERSGAQMDPALGHFGAVKAARILYTDVMNIHLETAGQVARLHPDRLEDRGVEYRAPEPRLRIKDSNDYKYLGKVSERMQDVLDHRQARAQYMSKERVQTREYWEGRKTELGLTRDMPMDTKRQILMQARAQRFSHAPARSTLAQLREQGRALTREVRGLERHVTDLQHVSEREAQFEQHRAGRTWQQELAAERVLAKGKAHGLSRDFQAEQAVAKLGQSLRQLGREDDHQQGQGLRVRLHERERERDGYGW